MSDRSFREYLIGQALAGKAGTRDVRGTVQSAIALAEAAIEEVERLRAAETTTRRPRADPTPTRAENFDERKF